MTYAIVMNVVAVSFDCIHWICQQWILIWIFDWKRNWKYRTNLFSKVVVVLVVLVMRKRIALVVQLFREAGKAVYAMPALLLQPIYVRILRQSLRKNNWDYNLTFALRRIRKMYSFPSQTYLLIGLSFFAWIYFILWIESAGDLYKNRKGHFHYKKDAILIVRKLSLISNQSFSLREIEERRIFNHFFRNIS